MKKIRIMVTGGHHTPALAVLEELVRSGSRLGYNFDIVWLGHKFSIWGDRNVSAEYQEITSLGFVFYDLKAGKFYKTFNPLKLIRIPWGFIQSVYLVYVLKPDLILTFGGYLGAPVVLAARIFGVRVLLHEQTMVAGWANRFIARFAEKVFISFDTSQKFFPKSKTVLTGNPVRSEIFVDKGLFGFKNKKKTIYITGGKQGSHLINEVIGRVLGDLLDRYNVIHQSGGSSLFSDFKRLLEKSRTLSKIQQDSYILREYFSLGEIGSVFSRADLVLSRAGANTVYELILLGKPSILVPISWSSHQEQSLNANFLSSKGAALVIEERDLIGAKILEGLDEVFKNYQTYSASLVTIRKGFPEEASKRIAGEIVKLLEGSGDASTKN